MPILFFKKFTTNSLVVGVEEDCILTFIFEAFDEPWKGSDDPDEPEKHWGLFYENRSPKLALKKKTAYKAEQTR